MKTNQQTPSLCDVDVLRNVFAARFAACMLTVFARTGSRVPVVVAHTTQLREMLSWNPLFVFEIVSNVLYTLARKTLKNVKVVLSSWLSTYMAPAQKIPVISPIQMCLFLVSYLINAIHTYHTARGFVR